MKNLWLKKNKQTKRGVASLYVVIFATMVFGIVALSCIRIMLSEVNQSSDDDFSRSAYDAAMAGVEDAKLAISKYYSCLNTGGSECDDAAREKLFQDNCDDSIGIANYLGFSNTSGKPEILVQEKNNKEGDYADQAYTCVIVSDVTPDYRGTLTNDTRTRVVPLKATGGNNNENAQTGEIDTVRLQWYSQSNRGNEENFKNIKSTSDGLPKNDEKTIPPTLSITYIRTRGGINPEDFHKSNNTSSTIDSSVLLLPSNDGSNKIDHIEKYGNANTIQEPVGINCRKDTEFACSVDITDVDIRDGDNAFLVVSLPYGQTLTDFSVSLYNGLELKKFKGTQISIDSTGRTNQLFRRVETRLEPSDLYFPYPQYALSIGTDEGGGGITKNFWITSNCWYNSKEKRGGTCNNNNQSSN